MNADGTLNKVVIDWRKKGNKIHKTWDNTIMGHLTISGRLLVAEVNSAKRAEKIRAEIERRMGIHAIHLNTSSKTPEEMLKEPRPEKGGHSALRQKEAGDPLRDPEIQREFAAMMQSEFQAWIHTKVPALAGRTPLEAVADPDGREIVEGFLRGWERQNENPGEPGLFRPDIDAIRRLLNLPA